MIDNEFLSLGGILSGTGSLQGSPIKKHHPSQDFIHSPSPTQPTATSKICRNIFLYGVTYVRYLCIDATPVLEAAAEVLKEAAGAEEPVVVEEETKERVLPTEPKKQSPLGALAILDPANFTLDGGQTNRHRVTKESFKNTSQLGVTMDPSDPLSQLDPLWSLSK